MTAAAPAAAPAADHGHKDPWATLKNMVGIGLGLLIIAMGLSAIIGPVEGVLNVVGTKLELIIRVAVVFTGLGLLAAAVKTHLEHTKLRMELEHQLRMLIANHPPAP